jgi:hypothetical protein
VRSNDSNDMRATVHAECKCQENISVDTPSKEETVSTDDTEESVELAGRQESRDTIVSGNPYDEELPSNLSVSALQNFEELFLREVVSTTAASSGSNFIGLSSVYYDNQKTECWEDILAHMTSQFNSAATTMKSPVLIASEIMPVESKLKRKLTVPLSFDCLPQCSFSTVSSVLGEGAFGFALLLNSEDKDAAVVVKVDKLKASVVWEYFVHWKVSNPLLCVFVVSPFGS